MKRQRGIADMWLVFIALIVLIGAVTAGIKAWDSFTAGLIKQGYDAGVAETRAKYAERDNAALAAANTEINRLQTAARKAEQDYAKRDAERTAKYDKEKRDDKKRHDQDIADARSGAIGLYDPGRTYPTCSNVGNTGTGTEASATVAVSDGGQGGQLSREAVQFLLMLANDADDTAKQLAAAQTVILEQIRTCNGP